MSPRSCAVRACPPAFVNVQEIANAPSTSAAVPIPLGDGGRYGGQNSSSSSETPSGRRVISVEGVRADVERVRVLLQLLHTTVQRYERGRCSTRTTYRRAYRLASHGDPCPGWPPLKTPGASEIPT